MKRFCALTLHVALIAGGVFILAGATLSHRTPSNSATDTYVVVKIGDKYEAIASKTMADRKKRLAEDNKKKMKEWEDERKSDPTLVRPLPDRIIVKKTGFNTQKGADDFIKEVLEKEDEDKGDGKDKAKAK